MKRDFVIDSVAREKQTASTSAQSMSDTDRHRRKAQGGASSGTEKACTLVAERFLPTLWRVLGVWTT